MSGWRSRASQLLSVASSATQVCREVSHHGRFLSGGSLCPLRRYSLIWPRAMKAKNVTIPMKMQATMMRSVLRDISSSRIAWTSVRSFAATIRVMTCSANVGGITTQREVTASSRSSNLGSSQRARRRGSCGCR